MKKKINKEIKIEKFEKKLLAFEKKKIKKNKGFFLYNFSYFTFSVKEIILENEKFLFFQRDYAGQVVPYLDDLFLYFEPKLRLIEKVVVKGRGSRKKIIRSFFSQNYDSSIAYKQPFRWFKHIVLKDKKYLKEKAKKNSYERKTEKLKESRVHRVNSSLKERFFQEFNSFVLNEGSMLEKQKSFEKSLF